MKKKAISICLAIVLCLCLVCPTFATGQSIGADVTTSKSTGDTVSKENLQHLVDKYAIRRIEGTPNLEEIFSLITLRDEITESLAAKGVEAHDSHNLEEVKTYGMLIDRLQSVEERLASFGVAEITFDELQSLLGVENTRTTTYPHDPPDTSYVTFNLLTGQSGDVHYFTILAVSNHFDATFSQAYHPLYNCHVTNCVNDQAAINQWVLQQAFNVLMSGATGGFENGNAIPGIFTTIIGSIFEDAITSGQSFDASIETALSQSMAYTYASYDETSYYSHILSAQRMSITPRYTIGCVVGGQIRSQSYVLNSLNAVTPYFNNITNAIQKYKNGDTSLYTYSVGTLTLRYYSFGDGAVRTKALPYTFYSEPQSIPGYI